MEKVIFLKELKEFLKALEKGQIKFGGIGIEKRNIKEIEVGQISQELLEEYRKYDDESNDLQDEKEMWMKKSKREFHKLFRNREYEMNSKKKGLWVKVYKELNVNKDDHTYTINISDGTVSKEQEEGESIKFDGIPFNKRH